MGNDSISLVTQSIGLPRLKMALVMLPCDLPWWPVLQRHLAQLPLSKSTKELMEGLQKIHNMCNISLDPDDDNPDPSVFIGLEAFLDSDMTPEEKDAFLSKTLPGMVQHALQLKQLKPAAGLHFSLQQQPDRTELDRKFVASLLAHAFFSTFPKRTVKTHPTLQDFNFTHFFRHLDNNYQKAKLRSILLYFSQFETAGPPEGKVVFSRQVMTSKRWLTIEDWLESSAPVCQLSARHEGRLERAEPGVVQVVFASGRLGGRVLGDGSSQECVAFCTHPELLVALPCVEVLEDNEAFFAEGVLQVSRVSDPRGRAVFEPLSRPHSVSMCCMDPENYMRLPLSQFEEDNVLRELNKALLGFRQQQQQVSPKQPTPTSRRLSPIGESFSSTPPECDSASRSQQDPPAKSSPPRPSSPLRDKEPSQCPPSSLNGRRGRFIVLGSSGECLPVSRGPAGVSSLYSSCHSDSGSEEFHSAQTSVEGDESDSDGCTRRYSAQLDTPERRSTFAARLRDALCRETESSSGTESSYAVGISVAGSGIGDRDIKLRRGGSRGFMLQEDSFDDQFLRESLEQEKEWLEKFRAKRPGALARRDTAESSQYSFSTDYGSELEELYDQYSRWLEEMDSDGCRELDARDIAVVRFAGSLLKRTLSDSFAGVSLTDGHGLRMDMDRSKAKIALVARSLSLELARHKHRMANQLGSLLNVVGPSSSGLRPVATGNWGCGSTRVGDPQLKLMVQWLAASMAGVPCLYYYTCGHYKLLKLDTLSRVLLDRQWTVGQLTAATLRFAHTTLDAALPEANNCLFDELIGTDKTNLKLEAKM